jgi:non-specific protein-tyrosine kinase
MVTLADMEQPRVIVTSADANEGKTITCTNLALSFARAGQRVVLVDLDLRHPTAHRLVGAHNEFGVTDVLLARRSLEDCLQYLELPDANGRSSQGLYFLGTGAPVSDPAELLGMGRTARMLDGLGRQADLILIDTPPVLRVADTLVIGRMASGALMVVEARKTAITSVTKAKDLLIRNQTRLLGIVLNKFQQRDAGLADGFGYGYGEEPATSRQASLSEEQADRVKPSTNGNGRSPRVNRGPKE